MMKKLLFFLSMKRLFSILFFLTVVVIGCNKDEDNIVPQEQTLNDYLKSMSPISNEMPAEKVAQLTSSKVDTTVEYIYKTDYYEAAAGYDEQLVMNPQTDVIFPGALIKGESVLDGTYTLIPAQRKPITISTSLLGGDRVSVQVADPKLSTIREAINNLMKQDYQVPYANMGFTVEQAYSESQLDLSLHASYKGFGVDVKGGFDFSNKNIQTRLVAKFIQSYYTLDMDMPNQPSELFDGDVSRTLFGTYMPMYVSTVTFGRMALFTIESTLSETQVRAYLDAAYAGVSGQSSSDFNSLKAKSTMKVYVLGGSGSDAAGTIEGFEQFKTYIQAGGNFSKASPGAPIAYKLRYIKDNTVGKIVFAASYPIVTAIPRLDNAIIDIKAFLYSFSTNATDGAGSSLELYGTVYTWPKSLGEGVKRDHFPDGDYLEATTHKFSENSTTARLWAGLKYNDVIMIKINIKEADGVGDPDDVFSEASFEVKVSDIILSIGTPDEKGDFMEKTDLKVYNYDDNQNINFTMRFYYEVDRI